MSANKVAETSVSSGSGPVVLAGAWSVPASFITGNRTFFSFYGLNHYFPYMIQDKAGNWEKGIGFLSDATTLVRESVQDNSIGTTSLIDFAAGEKLVMVPADAGSDWPNQINPDSVIYSGHLSNPGSNSSLSIGSERVYLMPYLAKRPMAVTNIQFECTGAGGSSTFARGAIYSASLFAGNEVRLKRISDQGTVAMSATGVKDIPVSATLGRGFYVVALVVNSSVGLRTLTQWPMDIGLAAVVNSTYHVSLYKDIAGASADLPTEITGNPGGTGSGLSFRLALKGRLL